MAHAIYTVQRSDEAEGLLGIARQLYGDGAHWPTIYDANQTVIGNNPSVVRAGQHLIIPVVGSNQPRALHVYRVQLADIANGLRGIAQGVWGDPERWRDIYAINRGAIGDEPHTLQPDQWLIIP